MIVRLTPEQEAIIQAELKSGHFNSIEQVIREALQRLQEKEQSSTSSMPNGEQREAVEEMRVFVEANRTRLDGTSVKQLMHEGHRA
jgi:putative addiction module CopG family antidote